LRTPRSPRTRAVMPTLVATMAVATKVDSRHYARWRRRSRTQSQEDDSEHASGESAVPHRRQSPIRVWSPTKKSRMMTPSSAMTS
jgi:hypothetical protein